MLINTKPIKQKKDIKNGNKPKIKTVIHRVKSEPKLQEKTVTTNGTVVADNGFDGLSKVTVNVSGGGGSSLNTLYCWLDDDGYEIFTNTDTPTTSDVVIFTNYGPRPGLNPIQSVGTGTIVSASHTQNPHEFSRYSDRDIKLS